MYLDHFGLEEPPFSTVPDPRFYYPSVKHREALACLVYAVQNHKGVALVTGDIGTGKTMLCRAVLNQIEGDTKVALLDYTLLAPDEFHQAVCESFDLSPEGSKFELRKRLGEYAENQKARGSDVVLIVDEAQNLSQEVLEELRSLSNLATPTHKLLQIILLGQPEFRGRISEPGMEALDQRITLKFHLGPLSREDTDAYISHRLKKAGADDDTVFEEEARAAVHEATGGVPRLINVLCDQALLVAYSQDEESVTAEIVEETVEDREGFYCEDENERSVRGKESVMSELPDELGPADAAEWQERYENLLREAKGLQKRLNEERQRADRLSKRVESLQEKIEKSSDKVETLQEKKREQEDELAARQREIEGLKQKAEEAKEARARQKKLRKKLDSLEEKVEGYLKRIDELQEQKHEQAETLKSRDEEIAELRDRLAQMEDEAPDAAELQKKLDSLQEEAEGYQKRIEDLEDKKQEQAEALTSRDEEIAELQNRLSQMEDQTPDSAGLEEERNSLREQVDEARAVRKQTCGNLFEAGEKALEAGHGEEARALLQAAVDLGLDSPLALYRLGSALFQTDQYKNAIEHYRTAISRLESQDEPDQILLLKAYNNCGVALARLGETEAALEMYQKAMGPDKDYASPYLNMALLYRDQLGDEEAAIEAFRSYIDLDGKRSESAKKAIDELKSGKTTV